MGGAPAAREYRVTKAESIELDDIDRELLNAVQWDFPLEPRPYAVLGERLGDPRAGGPRARRRR